MMMIVCPTCQGVGRVQRDCLGNLIPAPQQWVANNTSAKYPPGLPCPRCAGYQMVQMRDDEAAMWFGYT